MDQVTALSLTGPVAAALVRCLDGLSDDARVTLSRTDSLSNDLPLDGDGWLRVRVDDPGYLYRADDVISDTGLVSAWTHFDLPVRVAA